MRMACKLYIQESLVKSLHSYGRDYVKRIEGQGKKVAKNYQIYLSQLPYQLKDIPLSSIRRSHLQDIQTRLLTRGLANSTINNHIQFWSSVLTEASLDYENVRPPSTRGMRLPTKSKLRYLMDGEEQKLYNALHGTHRDLFIMLVDTGCRIGEALAMRWDDIDSDWEAIRFNRPKVDKEAVIHITQRLRLALIHRKLATISDFVFPSPSNPSRPMTYSPKVFSRAVEKCNLNTPEMVSRYGKFTYHSLRHTFASRLLQGGMSLAKVGHLLGHSDIKTTQIYAHLIPSDTASEAVEILNRIQGAV